LFRLINLIFLFSYDRKIYLTPSVIIIDDDPDIREVLSEFLRLKSIDVLATGSNGKDAVELYKKYTPDIVLIDFRMPDFDGLYGLRNIIKLDSNAKVIILTDSAVSNIDRDLTESGASAIFQKPCDMNHLVKTIDKLSLGDAIQLNN